MSSNEDLYSLIYDCDYNTANLKEVADKIREEHKIALSFCKIKNFSVAKILNFKAIS